MLEVLKGEMAGQENSHSYCVVIPWSSRIKVNVTQGAISFTGHAVTVYPRMYPHVSCSEWKIPMCLVTGINVPEVRYPTTQEPEVDPVRFVCGGIKRIKVQTFEYSFKASSPLRIS